MARVDAPDGVPAIVLGCYHPSRQNTNTGKLTPEMMESVFRKAKELLEMMLGSTPKPPNSQRPNVLLWEFLGVARLGFGMLRGLR